MRGDLKVPYGAFPFSFKAKGQDTVRCRPANIRALLNKDLKVTAIALPA